jgi:hypothetical protein
MTARIIWLFKNSERNAVAPRSALSAGAAHAARPVVLPQHGRAAPHVLSPVRPPKPARGNLGGSALRAAPLFDATAERWVVPPSTIMVDAGAADLRVTPISTHDTLPSPAAVPSAAGRFLREAVEVVSFAAGMTVFGLVAAVFLVMA